MSELFDGHTDSFLTRPCPTNSYQLSFALDFTGLINNPGSSINLAVSNPLSSTQNHFPKRITSQITTNTSDNTYHQYTVNSMLLSHTLPNP